MIIKEMFNYNLNNFLYKLRNNKEMKLILKMKINKIQN